MPSQQSAVAASWSDLLPELLGRIAACCPNPADRARFRSVCRSWHSAVRHHCPHTPPPPWVVLHDGSFLTLSDGDRHLPSAILQDYVGRYYLKPSDGGPHRLALPGSTTCVGSTDGWLALCRSAPSSGDTFLLHNPFSNTTVPLPGVDAVRARAPPREWFRVVKVLMRSGADDMVAVMTISRSYPFVLSLPGKGAWAPDPHAAPYMHIVDVAFLGDKLYGITKAEDLFSFDLSLARDDDGEVAPAITRCERVIRHQLDHFDAVPWSDVEDEEDSDDELDDLTLSGEDGGDNNSSEEEEGEEDSCFEDDTENLQVPRKVDFWSDEANKDCFIITIRYLVVDDSRGKLIMVKREMQMPDARPRYTRKVEVFEADTEAGAWVPLPGELGLRGGGQALFVSRRFSKCVPISAYGKEAGLEGDSIYFVDSGDVFHMRSATISPARWCLNMWDDPTWVFPPGFVA